MDILKEGQRVLNVEAKAISELSLSLGADFVEAVRKISQCKGKVVVTGIGKSGHIGRKLASTFSSTATSSFFVHPAESAHGDLGMIDNNDIVIAISNSGKSSELVPLIKYLKRRNIFLIAMTANTESFLGQSANIILNISVNEEACPLGLAPTTSTTVTLALGDALAMSVLKLKGVKEEDFAEFHPGGSLGKRLLTRVSDVMKTISKDSLVGEETKMLEVVSNMTSEEVKGIAGVVDKEGQLIGVITDGDIRRGLEGNADFLKVSAKDIMSLRPKTIHTDELAEKALFLMQQFKIQTLFALDKNLNVAGVLHLQDLLSFGLR